MSQTIISWAAGEGAIRRLYYIRSGCGHYNISKCWLGAEPRYTAWYTQRPDNRYERAVMIGGPVASAVEAQQLCQSHVNNLKRGQKT